MRHRVLPAPRHIICRQVSRGGAEVVSFEVAEHLVSVAEDRVVPDTGVSDRLEHLGPHASVGPDVFLDALGPDVEDERAALDHVASLADDGDASSLTIRRRLRPGFDSWPFVS